jgi:hypothetical protein
MRDWQQIAHAGVPPECPHGEMVLFTKREERTESTLHRATDYNHRLVVSHPAYCVYVWRCPVDFCGRIVADESAAA